MNNGGLHKRLARDRVTGGEKERERVVVTMRRPPLSRGERSLDVCKGQKLANPTSPDFIARF